jgi:S1-C subfamily serine protease
MLLFRFSDTLERRLHGRLLLVLLGLMVILNVVMGRWTDGILDAPGAPGAPGNRWVPGTPGAGQATTLETFHEDGSVVEPELLDLQFGASPDEIQRLIFSYGPVGRARYRWFALTIDMIYPLVYSLFLAGLISALYRVEGRWNMTSAGKPMGGKPASAVSSHPPSSSSSPDRRILVRLNLVPAAALIFDMLENTGVAVLLTAYPAMLVGPARAVTVFTAAKWVSVAVAVGLVVLGALRLVFLRLVFLRWRRGSLLLSTIIPLAMFGVSTLITPGAAQAQQTSTTDAPRPAMRKEPVPVLRLGETVTGEVPVTAEAVALSPQRTLYRVEVPHNAFALTLELFHAPADLDIVLRSADDEIIAFSESLLYDEVLHLTRYSDPALIPGEYLVEILYQYQRPPVVGDQVLATIPFSFTARAVIPPVGATLRPGSSVRGTLKPEEGMIDLFRVLIEPGATALRLDVSESIGDIDLVLNRGAPPWDLSSADFASMSIRSSETLVLHEDGVPPLVPGTWYLIVFDQVSDVFPVDYHLSVHHGRDAPPELLLPVTVPAGVDGVPDYLQQATLATVEVLGLEAGGSGVLVSPVGHIVTNLHVITAESGRIEENLVIAMVHSLGEPPRELFRAEVLETDPDRDLALLQIVSGRYGQPLTAGTSFPSLALTGTPPPRVGDPLHVLGYPLFGGTGSRATITYSRGSVAGFQRVPFGTLIKSDVVIGEGSSGGAALDSEYRLVGFPTEVVGTESGRIAYIYSVEAIPREWHEIIDAAHGLRTPRSESAR